MKLLGPVKTAGTDLYFRFGDRVHLFQRHNQRGADDALASFGLIKEAISLRGIAGGAKNVMFGNPRQYWNELKAGKVFSRDGMIMRSLNTRHTEPLPVSIWGHHLGNISPHALTAADTAMTYGMPAYSIYQGMQAPEGARGSATGSTLGSIAGGMLGAPLGAVGSVGGSMLGSALGENLGRSFNRPAPDISPAQFDPRQI